MNAVPVGKEFFVSNIFMEKVFDEISHKQDTISDRLEAQIRALTEKIENVIDIREKELPLYETKIAFTQSKMNILGHYMVRQKKNKQAEIVIKSVFQALLDHKVA